MKRLTLTILIALNSILTFGQSEEYNPVWIESDIVNYQSLLETLSDSTLLSNSQNFINKIVPFDIRLTKDLGFGLTLIKGGQYGGYTTAWVSILEYENEIVQFQINYSDDAKKIIEYLIKTDETLLTKVKEVNKGDPYEFNYKNKVTYDKYIGDSGNILPDTSNEYKTNFDLLTNPILNYDYGTRCYYGGIEPKGRTAINFFIALNDIIALREIMKKYNPEGRLYAVDALLNLSKDSKITLTNEDKLLIHSILSSKILISACQDCIGSESTADKLLNQKSDFSEENKVIKQENKIRKEQGIPKRKDY